MRPEKMRFRQLDFYFIYPFALPALEVLSKWSGLLKKYSQSNQDLRQLEYLPPYIKLHSEEIRFNPLGKRAIASEIKIAPSIKEKVGRSPALHSASLTAEIILEKNGGACCVFQVKISPQSSKLFDVTTALNFSLVEDYSATFHLSGVGNSRPLFGENKWKGQLFQLFEKVTTSAARELLNRADRQEIPFRELFSDGEFQHPFVMTVARLAEGTPYQYLNAPSQDEIKVAEVAENWRDLASLLIRTYVPSGKEADAIDDTYLHHTTEMNHKEMANLYPFGHLFTNLHYRSCLTIHGEYSNKRLEEYGEKYICQLKESVVTTRIQWFILLVLNARIDRLLGDYALKAPCLLKGQLTGQESEDLQQLLNSIVELRTSVSLVLNDPVAYGHAAGSFSHLFKRMVTLFRMDKLESSLQVKLHALDRMYDDLRELHRLNLMQSAR